MSVRNGIVLLLVLSTVSFLAGCGGNGNPTPIPPPSGSFTVADLSGTYVFSVSGLDFAGAPVAIVGAFIANGKGGITGGTIDINDAQTTPVFAVPINNNGFYNVSVDGRGQMTVGTPSNNNTNPFGTNLTFDFVITSSSHGLIIEFDGNASGSGSFDLQDTTVTQASLAGPYAFSFSGAGSSGAPLSTVGAFTLDQNGNISLGGIDINDGGIADPYLNQGLNGVVTLGPTSTPSTTLASPSFTLTFDVYAVDATHLKFIEMDSGPIVSGDAFSQTTPILNAGTMAFTLTSFNPQNPFAAGGYLATDGGGGITGTEDYNNGVAPSTSAINFTGNYSNSGSVTPSRYVLNNFLSFVGGSQYVAYPSSGGLLLMEADDLGITVGAAYLQTTNVFASSQGYGMNLSGFNLGQSTGFEAEVDDIAQFSTTSTVTGILDENFAPGPDGSALVPNPDLPIVDVVYGPVDPSGRYSFEAAVGDNNATSLNTGFLLTLYSADGTTFPFIESDSGQVATGVIVLQSAPSATPGAVRTHMFITPHLSRPHAVRKKQK
jgi:hypothetical protein